MGDRVNNTNLDILMMVPGLPFQGDTLETGSLGGSETAGLCMARELAKIGHHVTVFSNTDKPGNYDGVTYLPAAGFMQQATAHPHDVTIIQRMPEPFSRKMNSKLNLLWCHDLAMLRQAGSFKGVLWNVDKVMVVSKYMADQYKEVYGIGDDVIYQTSNGIDLSRFIGFDKVKRDRKAIVYTARPERGLDVLLGAIFPKILKRDPSIVLHLAGYNNTVEHLQDYYNDIGRMIESFGPSIKWHGHLKKADLYKLYEGAGVYVYPTPSPTSPLFAEVSCITSMECMAAGLPIVTSNRGALKETIGDGPAIILDGDPMSEEYQNKFVDAVIDLTTNDIAFQKASNSGRERAAGLDWVGVAGEWSEMMQKTIYEANDNPHRLAYHFIQRSDIMAAKELLAPLTDDHAIEIKAKIDRGWGFSKDMTVFREQYEKIGQTHTDVFDFVPREPRFGVLEKWLTDQPNIKRILDFGCAHGGYAINMCNRVGREWVGVDVDKYSIEWCEKNRSTRGKYPDQMKFMVGDDTVDLSGEEKFDALVAFEVLEHVMIPWQTIDRVERWIKPGGKVYITVPFGPWEYMSYDTYPHRCHLWEFDMHDLRDMLADKKNVSVWAMPSITCEQLAEPCGWHVIEYTVSGKPCRPIDMNRKLKLQRPKETVSVSIIAGPNSEDNLHWCLKSLKHAVTEINIIDTGMSDEAKRIAIQYTGRIVPGSNPLERGFEVPRNETLALARMDWVLWIDTDEKLINGSSINKYLRRNMFNGYSIRQHHFACDTTFKPDLPVRLFRNWPYQGKSLRWFGKIHEHPELGLNEGPGPVIVVGDIHIAHVGYLIENTRRQRFARNLPLLEMDIKEYPDRLLQKHFVCRDNMLINMYELQENGGKVTSAIHARCNEVIDIFRKYFLGKGGYLNTDTIEYYSQACQVLGIGADVAFQVVADKNQAQPNGAKHIRFATSDDLEKEMAWRSKEAVAPFMSQWW